MMHNPNVAMRGRTTGADLKARYTFTKGLPTRQNCDPTNPKEAFLWMFSGIPGLNGAPLFHSVPVLMMVSEHLWECGARPTEEPIKKYLPPTGDEPNHTTSPGRWVPPETPEPTVDPAREAVKDLSIPQAGALFRVLRDRMSPAQKRDILLDGLTPDEVTELLNHHLREQERADSDPA